MVVNLPEEWLAKALVTDGVLFTANPFLIPPEGWEDGGPLISLGRFLPLGNLVSAFGRNEEHSLFLAPTLRPPSHLV